MKNDKKKLAEIKAKYRIIEDKTSEFGYFNVWYTDGERQLRTYWNTVRKEYVSQEFHKVVLMHSGTPTFFGWRTM